jgi:hypothetical protein
MNYIDMKKKVLSLIEEINPNSPNLTDDPDIEAKYEYVLTQVMFEMARIKRIPDYVEIEVKAGDLIRFEDITDESDYEVYQIDQVRGVAYERKAQGTVIKILEDGTAEVEYFRYPTRITDKNREKYTFDFSEDVLEIMPYGIAADLLKSDVSAEYGSVYAARYEQMKQMIDPRYQMTYITIEGGI